MRISELSSRSGVPVATIKFYLREHVLHDGVRTAATQAQYDETHLARLALIRALIGVGGLSIARVQQVLHSIEHPPESLHDLLGRRQRRPPHPPTPAKIMIGCTP